VVVPTQFCFAGDFTLFYYVTQGKEALLFNFTASYRITRSNGLLTAHREQWQKCKTTSHTAAVLIEIGVDPVVFGYTSLFFSISTQQRQNSLTFTVYNEFIGLDAIATCFGL
jgi:hypothetical protein